MLRFDGSAAVSVLDALCVMTRRVHTLRLLQRCCSPAASSCPPCGCCSAAANTLSTPCCCCSAVAALQRPVALLEHFSYRVDASWSSAAAPLIHPLLKGQHLLSAPLRSSRANICSRAPLGATSVPEPPHSLPHPLQKVPKPPPQGTNSSSARKCMAREAFWPHMYSFSETLSPGPA